MLSLACLFLWHQNSMGRVWRPSHQDNSNWKHKAYGVYVSFAVALCVCAQFQHSLAGPKLNCCIDEIGSSPQNELKTMGGKKPKKKQRNCAKLCVNKFKADEINETKWMKRNKKNTTRNICTQRNRQTVQYHTVPVLTTESVASKRNGMGKQGKSGKKLFHYVYNYIFSGIQVFDMVYVDVS